MKRLISGGLLGSLAIVILFCATVQAEEASNGLSLESQRMPASELQKHDSAFAILMETYRQFQNHLIQVDYSNRLNAAASLPEIETRKEVVALATQERDLRLRRLAAQVAVFIAAYGHTRQYDEQAVGPPVRNRADMRTAAEKLRDFVIFAPATNSSPQPDLLEVFPASSVLLDKYPKP
jgi:hypothetical protein